jgi:hypothetical protein
VDEWLRGWTTNALLAEAGVAERKVRAMTREAVEPAAVHPILCVECGEIPEGAAFGRACAARAFGEDER